MDLKDSFYNFWHLYTIFCIFDFMERLIKTITKIPKCFYTGSIFLYIIVDFGGDWSWLGFRSFKSMTPRFNFERDLEILNFLISTSSVREEDMCRVGQSVDFWDFSLQKKIKIPLVVR